MIVAVKNVVQEIIKEMWFFLQAIALWSIFINEEHFKDKGE